MIMLLGWDYVSELWPSTGLLFMPHMSMEDHGGMRLAGENSWFVQKLSGNPTSRII
jgi:hypothetical protein